MQQTKPQQSFLDFLKSSSVIDLEARIRRMLKASGFREGRSYRTRETGVRSGNVYEFFYFDRYPQDIVLEFEELTNENGGKEFFLGTILTSLQGRLVKIIIATSFERFGIPIEPIICTFEETSPQQRIYRLHGKAKAIAYPVFEHYRKQYEATLMAENPNPA